MQYSKTGVRHGRNVLFRLWAEQNKIQAPNANLAQLWQPDQTKSKTSERQGVQTQEVASHNRPFKDEIERLLRADEFTFLKEAGSSLTLS